MFSVLLDSTETLARAIPFVKIDGRKGMTSAGVGVQWPYFLGTFLFLAISHKPALQAQRALSSSPSSVIVHTFCSRLIRQASFLTQHHSSIKPHYMKHQTALVKSRVLHPCGVKT